MLTVKSCEHCRQGPRNFHRLANSLYALDDSKCTVKFLTAKCQNEKVWLVCQSTFLPALCSYGIQALSYASVMNNKRPPNHANNHYPISEFQLLLTTCAFDSYSNTRGNIQIEEVNCTTETLNSRRNRPRLRVFLREKHKTKF